MIALSLKIVGNPKSNAGPEPLVNINNAYFTIPDESYAGVSAVPWFFVVTSDERQTVYKLVINRVHSVGAPRQGILVFGLGVPRGYRIAGGVSPATVLLQAKDLFMQRYTTCTDPSLPRYEFTPEAANPDPAPFEALLAQYSLEPAAGPKVTMNPAGQTASIMLPAAKIAELMVDVNYPQFSPYKEIVLAESVDQSVPTISVAVPRVPVYTVMANGMFISRVTDIDETIDVRTPDGSVMFTIRQILNGAQVPGVVFNADTETVSVNMTTRPPMPPQPEHGHAPTGGEKPYRIVINPARTLGAASALTLTVGGKAVRPDADGTYYLTPQMAQQVRVSYGGADYVVTDCRLCGNEYQLTIQPKKSDAKFLGMSPWLLLVVGAVAGLLMGLLVAYGYSMLKDIESKEQPEKLFEPEDFKDKTRHLKEPGITFEEIMQLHDQYLPWREDCLKADSVGYETLEAYFELAEAIVTDQFDIVYQYAKNAEEICERVALIDSVHLSPVIIRFYKPFSPDSVEASADLHRNHGKLKSFASLLEGFEKPSSTSSEPVANATETTK